MASMDELPLVACCAPLAKPTLTDEQAADLERVFKALADRNRVKILNVLVQAGEHDVCVCELMPALGVGQSTVSYHLKLLVDAGLLERERRGTFGFYRLSPGALERIGAIFAPAPAAPAAA
jgi:ArsR family transcriptional regulator